MKITDLLPEPPFPEGIWVQLPDRWVFMHNGYAWFQLFRLSEEDDWNAYTGSWYAADVNLTVDDAGNTIATDGPMFFVAEESTYPAVAKNIAVKQYQRDLMQRLVDAHNHLEQIEASWFNWTKGR